MSVNHKKQLVLIGGGHSHAIALKEWSKNSLDGVTITLISDVENTPYSGMLPGYVAGFYDYAETHINLPHLAQIAGANIIIDKAINLDLVNNRVICQHQQAVSFDYLSLDIGSTPKNATVPGASQYAIPAKPVPLFLDAWHKLLETARNNALVPIYITIIGGGVGGVELAFNMNYHLKKIRGKNCSENTQISLIHREANLLSGHNQKVSKVATELLKEKGIKLYLNTEVIEVKPQQIICEDKNSTSIKNQTILETNYIFWVTQADSPQWLKNSALAQDNRGFILVNNYLQSLSHPQIFATGDIATIKNYTRPKAGVFAVRQGKPLYKNWLNSLQQKPLESYFPQEKYLALIGTGEHQAIASWDNFCWRSPLLWLLKDYIDRKFMKQFN